MKKYEEYKNSGVDWFREIPKNWQLKRIDEVAKIVRGNTAFKKDELLDTGSYIALQYGKTYKVDEVNELFNFYVNDEFYKSNQIVRQGDTILISTSETIEDLGHTCFYNRTDLGLLGGEQLMLRPNVNLVNPKFLYYFSKYYSNEIKKYATGLKVYRYNIDDLKNILVPVFSISEQQAIANYLDAKTQAIDKKVSLLEQKIETYKKLKRTLINQTITKGLRSLSEVEMKDSGVSYISKIPSNWKIERIKDLFKIGRGRVIGQLELVEDGKYPVYSSQTENNGCLGYIDTYDFDGDLLTWTTDGANAGTVFRRSGKFNCTNVCGTLKPIRNNLDLNYMVYALQESAIHNKRIDTNGAKIMNNEMALIKVPLPPKSEQEEIAKYLDNKTATINAIVSNISKQIDTLKQLRKTLINDVVTGKIKVVE